MSSIDTPMCLRAACYSFKKTLENDVCGDVETMCVLCLRQKQTSYGAF